MQMPRNQTLSRLALQMILKNSSKKACVNNWAEGPNKQKPK